MPLLLSLLIVFATTASAQPRGLDAERAPLDQRRQALAQTLEQSPRRFVEESLALADAYDALATRYASESRSMGARGDAVTIVARAASAARYRLSDPRLALDLYRRAGALHAKQFPQADGRAYAEEIADIQQFELKDRAAAAATLELLRKFYAVRAAGELAQWSTWKVKWLDAEIAWLRTGKAFDGSIDLDTLSGFVPQLYYGFGAADVASVPLDAALNPYNRPSIPMAELQKKLDALPPSHNVFLRTWIFAARLPTTAAVRGWLTRNDPAGFWTASLLTLAAVADRDAAANADGDITTALIRTEDGKPTAVALLAREYAKTHKLPPRGSLKTGH